MKIFWVWEDEDFEIESERVEINTTTEFEEDEWQIALDIIENPLEIIIVSPIAGIELDEIDVSLKDGILIISWERKKPLELYLNGSILRVSEVFWWRFSRSVILPLNLDLDNIKAILEKNVLIIKIPKLQFNWNSISIEKVED